MFQYITCYSLSTVDSNLCAVSSRFNTSHVTLYLWQQKQVHLWNSFNTSHVTLYHWPIFPGTHYSLVSIHHMLLFIYEHIVGGGENDVVSIHHMLLFINMELSNLRPAEVSIHHMLLFICIPGLQGCTQCVSIHHMLLFIGYRSLVYRIG